MSDLYSMAPEENASPDGAARVVDLRVWKELRIPAAYRELQETSASESRDTGRAAKVDQQQMTSIDQQLEMLQALASRHYPDSEAERNACLVRLLTERLRQYAAMFHPLRVVEIKLTDAQKEMLTAKGVSSIPGRTK